MNLPLSIANLYGHYISNYSLWCCSCHFVNIFVIFASFIAKGTAVIEGVCFVIRSRGAEIYIKKKENILVLTINMIDRQL